MSEYLVVWAVELDAESADDAARKARSMQRGLHTTATIFEVTEKCLDCNFYHKDDAVEVDLMPKEDERVH